MPYWAVPTLPSVQATVGTAQPAHLEGARNPSDDGFAEGFNSAMNIKKALAERALGKIIAESTDANGNIDWGKFNLLASKDPNVDELAAQTFEMRMKESQSR